MAPKMLFFICSLVIFSMLKTVNSAPSDAMRTLFESYVINVRNATEYKYNLKDSARHTMSCNKVIKDPQGMAYLAVYQWAESNANVSSGHVFHVGLANSTDLLNWQFQVDLGANASMPYITSLPTGFIVAWEITPHSTNGYKGNRFNYYPSRYALFNARPTKTFDAPQLFSECAEGCPNIYSMTLSPDINNSVIDVGAHYFDNCKSTNASIKNDRQQRGQLVNFTTWTAVKEVQLDNAILSYGVGGNIGDRDALYFGGYQFGLIEGQYVHADFFSWKVFSYDYQTGVANQLNIITHNGSQSLANPSVTYLKGPNGQPAMLVSVYIFDKVYGEAGQLLYYATVENPPSTPSPIGV